MTQTKQQMLIDELITQYPLNTFTGETLEELKVVLGKVYEEGKSEHWVDCKSGLQAVEIINIQKQYINDGYQSALREIRDRVGSVENREYSGGEGYIKQERVGWNDCLDEIKKLIENI